MRDGESESDVIFGVAPISNVPKIEHCRFWSLPYNKKPVSASFRHVNIKNGDWFCMVLVQTVHWIKAAVN